MSDFLEREECRGGSGFPLEYDGEEFLKDQIPYWGYGRGDHTYGSLYYNDGRGGGHMFADGNAYGFGEGYSDYGGGWSCGWGAALSPRLEFK
jgi:hypothetical protein